MDKERLLRLIVMYADFRGGHSERHRQLSSMVFEEILDLLEVDHIDERGVIKQADAQLLANLGEANYG